MAFHLHALRLSGKCPAQSFRRQCSLRFLLCPRIRYSRQHHIQHEILTKQGSYRWAPFVGKACTNTQELFGHWKWAHIPIRVKDLYVSVVGLEAAGTIRLILGIWLRSRDAGLGACGWAPF